MIPTIHRIKSYLLTQHTKLFVIWPHPTYPVMSYLLSSPSHTHTPWPLTWTACATPLGLLCFAWLASIHVSHFALWCPASHCLPVAGQTWLSCHPLWDTSLLTTFFDPFISRGGPSLNCPQTTFVSHFTLCHEVCLFCLSPYWLFGILPFSSYFHVYSPVPNQCVYFKLILFLFHISFLVSNNL